MGRLAFGGGLMTGGLLALVAGIFSGNALMCGLGTICAAAGAILVVSACPPNVRL